MMLEPMGLAAGPVVPTREWRELYAALDCAAVAAIHPFYTASIREFDAAGRAIVGSAPVGYDGTEAWLQAIGDAANVAQDKIDAAKNRVLPAIKGALAKMPIKGRITLSRLRRLRTPRRAPAGRKRRRCSLRRHRVPAHAVERADRAWLEAKGVARPVPRVARTGPGRDARVRAGPRDRHHAGRAGREGSDDPGALLHQPHFGAAADGSGGRGLARHGRQRGAGEQGALRRRCRSSSPASAKVTPRRVGRRAAAIVRNFASTTSGR